jgi:two-component system, sensor histidine kinase and response regulator
MTDERRIGKIFVVDDNPANIQVIGTILREARYDVGFALDGRQALEMLNETYDYDLVLLDVKMPVFNGYEVCRAMKNDNRLREIPVIFLSASHETENIIAGFDTGAVDYVTKPFNAKELLARVSTHVQLKHRTLEVKQYAAELERLNATKDKFFSILAHDLRNPFEGILLLCRTLLHSGTFIREEVEDKLRLILSASECGNKLLENLLLWSRSQTGGIEYKPGMISVSKTVERCADLVRPQAEAKYISLDSAVAGDLEVMADDAMLSHILRNLLTNAIKFTNEKGKVKVRAERTEGGIAISVADNGVGISEADQKRLFRIDGNISSRPGTADERGSGLGLILCREFADKMGGSLSLESKPGKGSRFTFTMPEG